MCGHGHVHHITTRHCVYCCGAALRMAARMALGMVPMIVSTSTSPASAVSSRAVASAGAGVLRARHGTQGG